VVLWHTQEELSNINPSDASHRSTSFRCLFPLTTAVGCRRKRMKREGEGEVGGLFKAKAVKDVDAQRDRAMPGGGGERDGRREGGRAKGWCLRGRT